MTDEEVRNIKQETIDELAEQRQRRSCLKAKADKYLREVVGAQEILGKLSTDRYQVKGATPSAEGWPSYDDLVWLFDDLKDAEARIGQIQQRLREWGVID